MRFKVGNKWHECRANKPLMIELTEKDKENIRNMDPKATKYALFDDGPDAWNAERKLEWME